MLHDIVSHLDSVLNSSLYDDYCPNGLQVEGKADVKQVITGVSASLELFDRAIAKNADMILVHHGLFWDGQPVTAVGKRGERLARLLKNDISLVAYHLPLDAHPEYGNNAGIARVLGMNNAVPFGKSRGTEIGLFGDMDKSRDEVFSLINAEINSDARFYDFGKSKIRKIAVCSGGAQNMFAEAIARGADLFLTGEESEWVFHMAKEEKVHYVAAGHHATEKFGVIALGNYLKEKFSLDAEYIEVENPV